MLAKLKGYKTLLFNAVMTGLLLWRMLRPEDAVPTAEQVMPVLDTFFNSLEGVTVVGNVLLRMFTNTAVGKAV